jgi:hypothetical protein
VTPDAASAQVTPAQGAGSDAAAAQVAAKDAAEPVEDKVAAVSPEKAARDDDADEEALLRDAVPNAENAVIGEDDAEGQPAKPAAGKTGAAAKARPAAKSAKAETALVRVTSAPKGAIVRTKARVLGRTPINLHFKTDNTYELTLIKQGYVSATRRVAITNTKEKKVAVTLKKRPAAKRSFFKPHR